uniref:Hypothetical chloroplast RF20 n=1 Tax=Xylochloris irregularis TaxID=480381 RepID=A0A097KMD8_9CHLO|nr:hypothetical chloroplast RF20 [Xylochloris irregularis]AIT94356.1 hypothetical chloroplast RF20 [Xylochloris irregularis]
MGLYTRFFQLLTKLLALLEKKISFLKKAFSLALLFLLVGFLFGNCFGTFLFFLRKIFFWDGLLVVALLSLFEFVSSVHYRKHRKQGVVPIEDFSYLWYDSQRLTQFFPKLCNLFKIGFMFGFFVDAFKVGS